MANEIDLYNDLEFVDEMLAKAKKEKNKQAYKEWKAEQRVIIKELRENYPDMFWNK